MKLLTFALMLAATVCAQPARKSKLDETKGAVTLHAESVLKSGRWQTNIVLTSPNTDSFKICFRYFDGITTRSIIRAGSSYAMGEEVTITIDLPLEVVETGTVVTYEMLPITVTGFAVH